MYPIQKINGFLNVFGIYDHTNNRMRHGMIIKGKQIPKQLLDFINRVDKKYDDNIKQIFLVLGSAFAYKSK